MADAQPTIRLTDRKGVSVLVAGGAWTVFSLRGVSRQIETLRKGGKMRAVRQVDASGVSKIDTAGALELLTIAGADGPADITTRDQLQADLFAVVKANMRGATKERRVNWFAHWLEEIGLDVVHFGQQLVALCAFFGEIVMVFAGAFLQPRRFRFNAVVRQMFEVWVKALSIVGILCFLIGVVIAYQGVQQLKQFGAETFTVEAVAIGMFRELGVLLTAIIVAGRSGSAFTAQIGTMQVNQEVDAMDTIGLNPIE